MGAGNAGRPIPSAEETKAYGADYLFVRDLQKVFGCGYSKARLMMDSLPSVRIGHRDCILRKDLDAYLDKHKCIDTRWPKRRR